MTDQVAEGGGLAGGISPGGRRIRARMEEVSFGETEE